MDLFFSTLLFILIVFGIPAAAALYLNWRQMGGHEAAVERVRRGR